MSTVTAELTARAGALAPHFILEKEIGRGGMGVVYRGMDAKLERPVAIKVLPEALAEVNDVRERFLREARTAARLSHPNIVPVFRADELHGVVFIVMALVEGDSLGNRLAMRGTLTAHEVMPILHDVALALDHAHAHGVVHRDIKPENILIERSTGRAVVTDFGIARVAEATPLTATGQVLGTVHYMSPEQVSGEGIDGRSDLYSLGVVGFRALTGRLPFDSESASAVLVAHVVKAPPQVREVARSVPVSAAALIDRCLAKRPDERCVRDAAIAPAFHAVLSDLTRDDASTAGAAPAVLSEREAQALWSRAAELQAMTGVATRAREARTITTLAPSRESVNERDRRTLTSGYRYTDVRDAAAEAGISEKYVSRAAAELGLALASPNDAARRVSVIDSTAPPSPWAGAPMALLYEVQISGEVPDSELYLLVDTIRRRLGDPGHVGTIGRSVSWSSSSRNRQLQISIVPRQGTTTIRMEERLGQLAGALYGGIVGGGGGGSAGLSFGVGLGALHSLGFALGLWGGIVGGTLLLARITFKSRVRARRETLRLLAEELADQARSLMKVLPRVP